MEDGQKKLGKLRNACFTAWNIEKNDFEKSTVQYWIYGIEKCPKTGRIHYQGYIQMKNPATMKALKKIIGDNSAHIEAQKGTNEQAINYCKKENQWCEGGEPKGQGKRTDLEDIKIKIIEEKKNIRDCKENLNNQQQFKYAESCIKYFGKRRCWDMEVIEVQDMEELQSINESYDDVYWCEDFKWWDGYDGHEYIVITDKENFCTEKQFEKLCSAIPMKVAIKGGMREFTSKVIFWMK